jgi:hypothetical protein
VVVPDVPGAVIVTGMPSPVGRGRRLRRAGRMTVADVGESRRCDGDAEVHVAEIVRLPLLAEQGPPVLDGDPTRCRTASGRRCCWSTGTIRPPTSLSRRGSSLLGRFWGVTPGPACTVGSIMFSALRTSRSAEDTMARPAFDGKQGVAGSSPAEGLQRSGCNGRGPGPSSSQHQHLRRPPWVHSGSKLGPSDLLRRRPLPDRPGGGSPAGTTQSAWPRCRRRPSTTSSRTPF